MNDGNVPDASWRRFHHRCRQSTQRHRAPGSGCWYRGTDGGGGYAPVYGLPFCVHDDDACPIDIGSSRADFTVGVRLVGESTETVWRCILEAKEAFWNAGSECAECFG